MNTCGNYDYGGVSAVAAASMFHFTEQTPQEAKEFCLKRRGCSPCLQGTSRRHSNFLTND